MPIEETATNLRTGETVRRSLPTPDEAYLAGLETERDFCTRRGLTERVTLIDAEITRMKKRLGVTASADPPAEMNSAAVETAVEPPVVKRGPGRPRKHPLPPSS